MLYPTRSDYISSIKNPKFAFRKKDPCTGHDRILDPDLSAGKPIKASSHEGDPRLWIASGNFACVFKYVTPSPRKSSPQKLWAVRCFLKSTPGILENYSKISARLFRLPSRRYFAPFKLIEEGIRVNGEIYPILKMAWVEGEDLKTEIQKRLPDRAALINLTKSWVALCRSLQKDGIVHGDLQHENILVINNPKAPSSRPKLKLIDYDSLYLQGEEPIAIEVDEIKGIPGYQHPLREKLTKKCIEVDFFSQIIIYISLIAVQEKPEIWDDLELEDSDSLLFSELDIQNPEDSQTLKYLADSSPRLAKILPEFIKICRAEQISEIPSFEQFLLLDEEGRSELSPNLWERFCEVRSRLQFQASQLVDDLVRDRLSIFLIMIGIVIGALSGAAILAIQEMNKPHHQNPDQTRSTQELLAQSRCL